jgi:hypothetical protein
MLGLSSMSEAHTGRVTFIQRFDAALRLNLHFHSLFLDGVFVRDDEGALALQTRGFTLPQGRSSGS